VVEAEPPEPEEPTTTTTATRIDLQPGMESVRRAHSWLRSLGDLGIALQLVVFGLLLVWFARRAIGIHSTAFLLVVLLLPAVAFFVIRRPESLAGVRWFEPVRAFRGWLAGLGEIGRVIELGLLGLFLVWFTKAVAGVYSVWLFGVEFLSPQAVYLILTGRTRSEPDDVVRTDRDAG
jgi:hypothetical protein